MKKLSQEQKDKLKASLELLCEENTTFEKIKKISSLIKGTDGNIDKKLKYVLDIADKINKVSDGDVITLSAENLPEDSDKNKKRKKLILLLLSSWKDLHGEVERIQGIQSLASATGVASKETLTGTGKIIATAKGPLGVVTILAAGIVAVASFLNSNSVNLTVRNIACYPIGPFFEQGINLPGLKLPSEAITSGSTGVVTIPKMDYTIDITQPGIMKVTALGFSQSVNLPNEIVEIRYNQEDLFGKVTKIDFSDSKTHDVILWCNKRGVKAE